MAEIARRAKRYSSDLTDEKWERTRSLMSKPSRGRKLGVDLREIRNTIRYMARSAEGWRMLPREFGPWRTVCWCFRRFVRRLLFRTLHHGALMLGREQVGREASPSEGVLDSRLSRRRSPSARLRRRREVVGRRRHIAVDTDGRLLTVNLTTADVSDSAGARLVLDGVCKR